VAQMIWQMERKYGLGSCCSGRKSVSTFLEISLKLATDSLQFLIRKESSLQSDLETPRSNPRRTIPNLLPATVARFISRRISMINVLFFDYVYSRITLSVSEFLSPDIFNCSVVCGILSRTCKTDSRLFRWSLVFVQIISTSRFDMAEKTSTVLAVQLVA
jgi:hypothetical protein